MPDVIVFDYLEPRQRLMSWFLKDSGVDVERVTDLEELATAMAPDTRVLIFNTLAPNSRIAELMELIERPPEMRVIVLHGGKHVPDDPMIDADICIHDVSDPDFLVETVAAAIRDRIPEVEPHVAGELLEETGG